MIYLKTKLLATDNSGARIVECIKILGGTVRGYGSVGDIITVAIKTASVGSKIKKGSVHRAVVVRTINKIRRKDGSSMRFDSNAVVILNEKYQPVGTRIFGPIARELRDKFMKVISLAPEVL